VHVSFEISLQALAVPAQLPSGAKRGVVLKVEKTISINAKIFSFTVFVIDAPFFKDNERKVQSEIDRRF
jgi:hypothetical protein